MSRETIMSARCSFVPLAMAALVTLSCGSVDATSESDTTSSLIQASTGASQVYSLTAPEISTAEIAEIFAEGLTLQEALSLGLRNSRSLQAAFQRIGVAKSDWVRSGLPSNPLLSIAFLAPEGGGRSFVGGSLVQSLVDIWNIPLQSRVASEDLQQCIYEVADTAARLARDIRTTYGDAQGADETLLVEEANLEVAARMMKLISASREAGASTDLDVNMATLRYLQAEVALPEAKLQAAVARRELLRLLSLDLDPSAVKLVAVEPSRSTPPLNREQLVAMALSSRLDLRAQGHAIASAEAALGLAEREGLSPVSLGVNVEREARRGAASNEIDAKIGPTLEIGLPIVNHRAIASTRAEYVLNSLIIQREALHLRVVEEVRLALDTFHTAEVIAKQHATRIVPQAQLNLELTSRAFEQGRLTSLAVMESQKQQIEATRNYATARRSLAKASIALESSIGLPWSEINKRTSGALESR